MKTEMTADEIIKAADLRPSQQAKVKIATELEKLPETYKIEDPDEKAKIAAKKTTLEETLRNIERVIRAEDWKKGMEDEETEEDKAATRERKWEMQQDEIDEGVGLATKMLKTLAENKELTEAIRSFLVTTIEPTLTRLVEAQVNAVKSAIFGR